MRDYPFWAFPWGPSRRENNAGEYADQMRRWLRETLVDDHKVLQALVDYIERLQDNSDGEDYERRQKGMPSREEFIPALIDEGRSLCGDVWEKTYKNLELNHVPSEFKERELLRQARRLTKLAHKYVEGLIEKSEKSKSFDDQKKIAEAAIEMSERFAGSLATWDSRYRHPEGPKWKKLLGQAKRRMSKVWLASAQADEAEGNSRSTSYKMPLQVEGGTWENAEEIGFRRGSVCTDGVHREVYLPLRWSLENDGNGQGRLIDSYKRKRADITLSGTTVESVKFIRRFELVEMVEDGKRWFRIVDHAHENQSSYGYEWKIPVDADPARIKEDAEYKFSRCESAGNPITFPDAY